MRVAPPVVLKPDDRRSLERWASSRTAPARLVERARIVLLAADGNRNDAIAKELHLNVKTVGLWRRRFVDGGLVAIQKDRPRGAPERTVLDTDIEKEVVRRTTQERPTNATHWSLRTMAKAAGISPHSVRRIWKRHGLKPHLVESFKVSNDPDFAAKVEDIVGLYMSPPVNALVLSADEKSQIQALERTQLSLPLSKKHPATMTHDYRRNGTTTLFAALCVLTGHVISTCMPRHRHQEWLRFLKLIDRETPAELDLHLIVDNYATHKHPKVRAWLKRHPRFHLHFTPTSASWLNMVERFFRDITEKRIRRDSFDSVDALTAAIDDYIAKHNEDPTPFVWTAKAKDILAKVMRARQTLDKGRSV